MHIKKKCKNTISKKINVYTAYKLRIKINKKNLYKKYTQLKFPYFFCNKIEHYTIRYLVVYFFSRSSIWYSDSSIIRCSCIFAQIFTYQHVKEVYPDKLLA